jgi:uncharacterized membrane protein
MNGEGAGADTKPIAALTYLLGFVTGVLFLYIEPYNRDDFVRFHARQSIVLSVAWFALNVVVGLFVSILPHAIGGLLSFLQGLVNLGVAVLWVAVMYKAYTGERYRIPELSNIVDQVFGAN